MCRKGLTKKPKDQEQSAVNHKKELARKIEDAKQLTLQDSGYEDERELPHDDNAVELIGESESLSSSSPSSSLLSPSPPSPSPSPSSSFYSFI